MHIQNRSKVAEVAFGILLTIFSFEMDFIGELHLEHLELYETGSEIFSIVSCNLFLLKN